MWAGGACLSLAGVVLHVSVCGGGHSGTFSGHMPGRGPWLSSRACGVLPGVPRLMEPGREQDVFLDPKAASLRRGGVVAAVLEPFASRSLPQAAPLACETSPNWES